MSRPSVEIRYCTKCKFLLRAAWLAQELLSSFEKELQEVILVPSSGGILEIRIDDHLLFSNKKENRLPEVREIKLLIRDLIAPDRQIGHR